MNALQAWESTRQPSVVYCLGLPPESWRKVSEKGGCVNQNLAWEATNTIMSIFFNDLE